MNQIIHYQFLIDEHKRLILCLQLTTESHQILVAPIQT